MSRPPAPRRPALFLPGDTRSPLRRAGAVAGELASLLRLPPRSALFYLRALAASWAAGDYISPFWAARPVELVAVHRAARGARRVVEIGTGRGWTAASLTVARKDRQVSSIDVKHQPERDRFIALMPAKARARLELLDRPGEAGPWNGEPVDLVFIDSSHLAEETKATFRAWEPSLRPGGAVCFHDSDSSRYPEVRRAIQELGLVGEARGQVFTWRKPGGSPAGPR